jgi:hypothetical protein
MGTVPSRQEIIAHIFAYPNKALETIAIYDVEATTRSADFPL